MPPAWHSLASAILLSHPRSWSEKHFKKDIDWVGGSFSSHPNREGGPHQATPSPVMMIPTPARRPPTLRIIDRWSPNIVVSSSERTPAAPARDLEELHAFPLGGHVEIWSVDANDRSDLGDPGEDQKDGSKPPSADTMEQSGLLLGKLECR
ncbi:hypothetical protein VTL71DRAFT_15576 [Oculimacula yallundae]|uniref:Uncharacterized protein n=1 Tax=Oculimacula yallundae TaxID=86028 RepID=A0ABR4CH59_9HELO